MVIKCIFIPLFFLPVKIFRILVEKSYKNSRGVAGKLFNLHFIVPPENLYSILMHLDFRNPYFQNNLSRLENIKYLLYRVATDFGKKSTNNSRTFQGHNFRKIIAFQLIFLYPYQMSDKQMI